MSDGPAPNAGSRADRFLAAFQAIEKHVQLVAQAKPGARFADALTQAMARSADIGYYERELQTFARLRNAIVHEPREGGAPIADPRKDAVLRIEAIEEVLLKPPRALSVLTHPVVVASPELDLREATSLMFENSYSQLPVLTAEGPADILTSQGVARYLATAVFENGGVSPSATVGEVVACDPDRHLEVASPGVTALGVAAMFEVWEAKGALLNAVLITGTDSSQPMGIATLYDLPALLRAARL